jgi:hypothetical protein
MEIFLGTARYSLGSVCAAREEIGCVLLNFLGVGSSQPPL